MPHLSTLRGPVYAGLRSAILKACKAYNPCRNAIQVRMGGGGGNRMPIAPSQFEWNKMKDDIHFYVCLTAIPLGIFIAYMQIRIGPAKLVEIPEGYVPEEYEYLKDPIQRFMKRYSQMYSDYSKVYERTLYYLDQQDQERRRKVFLKKVRELNTKRQDIRGLYFVPDDIQKQNDTLDNLMQAKSRF